MYPKFHVSLYVSDISKTKEFYSMFFGEPAVKEKSNYLKFVLQQPNLVISFIENKDKIHSNFGHLGFQVETEAHLKIKLKQAKANGFIVKEEIGTNCCYALQDKFWVNDPDGYAWEVYYFHEDSDFNDPFYEKGDTEVCCMPAEKPKLNLRTIKPKQVCTPESGCC